MNLVFGIIKILYMKFGVIIFNESLMYGDIWNFFFDVFNFNIVSLYIFIYCILYICVLY